MGELLLCSHAIAKNPFYLDQLSLSIYSMEELCYCMEKNPDLLDEEFVSIELCRWIGKELEKKELAVKLEESRKKENFLPEAVDLILAETHYCSREAETEIKKTLRERQKMSFLECQKRKADRLLENRKYRSAILEYRRLLQREEECGNHPVICGNIWHNLGTAFSRLYLFQEAAECFEKAYVNNQNHESMVSCMKAYWYGEDMAGLERIAASYGILEEEKKLLCEECDRAKNTQEVSSFETQLDEWLDQGDECFGEESGLMQLIEKWKTDYQKNCRV